MRDTGAMPTLLLVNNYHYRRGGADVVYLEQQSLFEKRDWTVVPFAMQHGDNLPSPWAASFTREIEYGRDYGALRVAVNAAKSIYSIESRTKIRQLIRRTCPDIAHAHNVYHHLSPSVLAGIKSEGVPVVMTLHDLKLLCPARTMVSDGRVCERCKGGNLHNVIRRRCMKGSLALSSLIYAESAIHRALDVYRNNVDRFIAPSRFLISKFVEWGWRESDIAYIPNYVDASRTVPEYSAGRAILYLGRLSEEKGLATLIRAAATARVPISLVGSGPIDEELKRLATALGADVSFLGFKTGPELWRLIGSSRAIVLPSEVYENAPLSILEAYATGKPVIGARIGGIPELIRDGETGWLFESGDATALADALAKVAGAPDTVIANLGRAARRWTEEEFTPGRHFERLIGLYASLGIQT